MNVPRTDYNSHYFAYFEQSPLEPMQAGLLHIARLINKRTGYCWLIRPLSLFALAFMFSFGLEQVGPGLLNRSQALFTCGGMAVVALFWQIPDRFLRQVTLKWTIPIASVGALLAWLYVYS